MKDIVILEKGLFALFATTKVYPGTPTELCIGIHADNPTELYVAVMTDILTKCPDIIGQKETHFTTDSDRAGQYTGTTREVYINGKKVYIKTGFATKDKWIGIEKTCQLARLTFELYSA